MTKIRCPHCKVNMVFSQTSGSALTTGNNQPKCKHCGKRFRLMVSGDEASNQKMRTTIDGDMDATPSRLGGYRIISQLGAGAMGKVYQAKQISLDRPVALKTIKPSLIGNPSALARFTREAYAAAQMTHHNVVQIYDFGEDDGQYFFSMEWVRGGSLSNLVRRKGSLDPRLAASYTLQAARGLQAAHDAGLIHRDIKPANLLLTNQGVVKVADLGLVKIADLPDPVSSDAGTATAWLSAASGTEMTLQGTAVGTPAYMSPEQAMDSATVDHRADIYSLGCTLFYFVCGRPPFSGSDMSQMIDAHLHAAIPDATKVKPSVPKAITEVIQRCLAKLPSGRYQSITNLIVDLETFLNIRGDAKFSPTSDQADRWRNLADQYNAAAKLAKFRPAAIAIGATAASILWLATPWLGGWMFLSAPTAVIAALITANCLHLVAPEPRTASPVAASMRRLIASTLWPTRIVSIFTAIAFVVVALATRWWLGSIVGIILGGLAGGVYHWTLVRPLAKQTEPVVKKAQVFVRNLRLAGVQEDSIREFSARHGGRRWRELFSILFGYEAATKMRSEMQSDRTFDNVVAATWQDWIVEKLDAQAAINRGVRDARKLAEIEAKGLRFEGFSAADAKSRSRAMASALMHQTRLIGNRAGDSREDLRSAAAEQRRRIKTMLADARSGKYKLPRDRWATVRSLLGGQTRLLAGLILLAIFAVWGRSSGLFNSLAEIDVVAIAAGNLETVQSAAKTTAELAISQVAQDDRQFANTTSPWSIGIAAVLLSASAFVSGWRMTPFAIVATIVILWGHWIGVPSVAMFPSWVVAAAIGTVIYIPGVIFGESDSLG